MIKVFFCDVATLSANDFEHLMQKLPDFMQGEIRNYKNFVDQKTRLIARIMLLNSLTEGGVPHLIHLYRKQQHGKPVIDGWDFFNISHSDNYVVMCHGAMPLGIDIEHERDIDITGIEYFFHENEKKNILTAPDKLDAFYQMWVKKEAFLKATGLGLLADLNAYNTLQNHITFKKIDWHFYPVNIAENYRSCLCTTSNNVTFTIVPFDPAYVV